MAERYLMFSLDDEKSKDLAEVLGNHSCKKIMVFLAEKNASASEISKQLRVPLNTVTYNIEKLVKSGLVEKESHWWSVKGKKIPIYTLSSKQIIISPKRSSLKKLKTIIPVILASGFIGILIKYFSEKTVQTSNYDYAQPAMTSLQEATPKVMAEGGNLVAQNLTAILNSNGSWFMAGCLFAVLLYLILEKYNERRQK